MNDSGSIRDEAERVRIAVTHYARNYINQRWDEGHGDTFEAIAKDLGCSSAYVQQVSNLARYPKLKLGPDVEFALARRTHDGSVDDLRKAALHIYGGGRYVVEDAGKRLDLTTPSSPSSAPPQLSSSARGAGGSRRRIKRSRRSSS